VKRLWAQFPANLRNSTQPGLRETLLRAPAGQAQETLARSQSEIIRESISGAPAPTGEQGAQSAICSDQVLMHCCSCAPTSEDIPEKISGATELKSPSRYPRGHRNGTEGPLQWSPSKKLKIISLTSGCLKDPPEPLIYDWSNQIVEFSRPPGSDLRVFSSSCVRSSSFLVLTGQIVEFSRACGSDRRVFSC